MRVDLNHAFIQSLPTTDWLGHAHEGVLVVFARTTDWFGWLGELTLLLDSAESERMVRKRYQQDRDTLTLAYGLRRLLLAGVLGHRQPEPIAPQSISILREASGQPRLGGLADWSISLSHSRDAVAIAVGAVSLLGVDLEDLSRAEAAADIRSQVLHADDLSLPDFRSPNGPDGRQFLELWVRKESILKAAGTGLAVPMTSFAAPVSQSIAIPGNVHRRVEVRMLEAPVGLLAAVAVPPATSVHAVTLTPHV